MEAEVRIELTESRFAGGHNFQSVIQPSGESTESRTQNLGFVDLYFIPLEYRLMLEGAVGFEPTTYGFVDHRSTN